MKHIGPKTTKYPASPLTEDDAMVIQNIWKVGQTFLNTLNSKSPLMRTIMVALNISKAFDTVNHGDLLNQGEESTLPSHLYRWISQPTTSKTGRPTYTFKEPSRNTKR